jgi:hypothetical protein
MKKPTYHDELTELELRQLIPSAMTTPSGKQILAKVFVRKNGDGRPCIVLRCDDGSFHVFVEVLAKQAAEDCGVPHAKRMHCRDAWGQVW